VLDWLGGLPLFVLFILFSGTAILITIVVERLMRGVTAPGPKESIGATAATVLNAVTVVYAILLGFVIVDEYGQFNDAQQQVGNKASSLVAIVENANAFPPHEDDEITRAVLRYTRDLVDRGIPRLAEDATYDPKTSHALHALYRTVQSIEPTSRAEQAAYQAIVGSLDEVLGTRSELRESARASIPPSLFFVLVLLGVLTMATAAVLDTRHRRSHLVILSILAIAVGANLALVVGLDYPFKGTIEVTDTPLVEILEDPTIRAR